MGSAGASTTWTATPSTCSSFLVRLTKSARSLDRRVLVVCKVAIKAAACEVGVVGEEEEMVGGLLLVLLGNGTVAGRLCRVKWRVFENEREWEEGADGG